MPAPVLSLQRPHKFTEEVQEEYLKFRSEGCSRKLAAANVGVSYEIVRNHCNNRPEFGKRDKEAAAISVERVECALFQAAVGGNVPAQTFYLKNRAPDKWSDTRNINASIGLMSDADLIAAAKGLFVGTDEAGHLAIAGADEGDGEEEVTLSISE